MRLITALLCIMEVNMMECVLGIDLGSGSIKGVIVNRDGSIVLSQSVHYEQLQEKLGYSEQSPEVWINGFQKLIHKLVSRYPNAKSEIKAISISGQMHSLVLLNKEGKPLRNAILWNDTRTSIECEEIKQAFGKKIINITGNKPMEGLTLPKILWVQKHEPEIWQETHQILLPKDYLGFYLSGIKSTDTTDASGTMLLDLKTAQWSQEILEYYGIEEEQLPKIYNPGDVIGVINTEVADILGLGSDVLLIAGGADNACSAIATGIIKPDTAMLSIGTSGVFLALEDITQGHNYDGSVHLFRHPIKNKCYAMGVTLSAGYSLSWFQKRFANEITIEQLIEGASRTNHNQNQIFFTPYIMGERTPYTDSKIRGSLMGLDVNNTIFDLALAVIEGITFSLADCKELIEATTGKYYSNIVSTGGGAKSEFWLQLQSNILNSTIHTLVCEEGAGFGAAILAAVGMEWFSSVEIACVEWVKIKNKYTPNKKQQNYFKQKYMKYKQVYRLQKTLDEY